jgi:hypothetical protein
MTRMLERLEWAMGRGVLLSAALSACSAEDVTPGPGGGGEPAATAGSGGTTTEVGGGGTTTEVGGSGGEGAISNDLPEYPARMYPTCSGPSYGDGGQPSGYEGQCCVEPLCFTPESGECPAADKVGWQELPGFPPGSGSCGCSPVEGPFAPRAEHDASSTGRCCYLVGSIGCEGRPLLVAGVPRVAGGTRRADWSSRPSWV